MSLLFPIKIDGTRFFTNPTAINVKKKTQIAEMRTLLGTTFQTWPNLPDEITFEGFAFGLESIFELKMLQQSVSKNFTSKEVAITYKFRTYQGFIRDMEISNDADKPFIFAYKISFVSKTPFDYSTMSIGQTLGVQVELDYLQAQLKGTVLTLASVPANLISGVAAVGETFSKIGITIGRPAGALLP